MATNYASLSTRNSRPEDGQTHYSAVRASVRLDNSAVYGTSVDPEAKKVEWEIEYSELEMDTKIGEGAYGAVFKGTYLSTPVAVKQIKENATQNDKFVEEFRKEAQLMKNIKTHPNIVLLV